MKYFLVFSLLSPRDKRRLCLIFMLMIGAMLLETLSIGLILPVLALITQKNSGLFSHPQITAFLSRLGEPNETTVIIGAMIVLVIVFAFKAIYLFLTIRQQTFFFTELERELSGRLFAHYLAQPYLLHLSRNRAELLGRLQDLRFFAEGFGRVLQLLAESLVLGGIFALLIFTEFYGTLIVSTIVGGLILILHYALRRRLQRLGQTRLNHELLRQQHALQGLHGVKEIKLLGREKEFIARYAEHNQQYISAMRGYHSLTFLPRYCLELLAVVGLTILIAWLLQRETNNFLPIIGLFVGAVFRIIPAVNRIIFYLQHLQFSTASIVSLSSELATPISPIAPITNSEKLFFREKITFDNIGFIYPQTTKPALHNVNLTINAKTTTAIVGASGAGKSTLLNILLGLLTPSSGRVLIDGVDLQNNIRGWQAQIGYVPQDLYLLDDTLKRNIAFGLSDDAIDENAINHAVISAQLSELIAQLPQGINTIIGERGVRLSGGQRQRIGIARALYHAPEILIFDEATASLDANSEQQIMNAIKQLHGEKTIIIIAHHQTMLADQTFTINDGELQ